MNIFGGIGLVAAIDNYRTLKAKLQALIERRDALQTAVQTYGQWKSLKELESLEQKVDYVNNPEDLQVTTILKVANLVGNKYRSKAIFVISNLGEQQYKIKNITGTCFFEGFPVDGFEFIRSGQEHASDYRFKETVIKPGSTIEFDGEKQIFTDAERKDEETGEYVNLLDLLKKHICEYCGKRLITSCPKVNIDDMSETADINFQWAKGDDIVFQTAEYRKKPGVLRYCKELSLIGE